MFDPKGELYKETSAWRAKNVGPVYRIAPFDDGADPATHHFSRHGFNPLASIRSQHQARGLAQLMFSRDLNGQEFFNDDAVGLLRGAFSGFWIQRLSTSAKIFTNGACRIANVTPCARAPHHKPGRRH